MADNTCNFHDVEYNKCNIANENRTDLVMCIQGLIRQRTPVYDKHHNTIESRCLDSRLALDSRAHTLSVYMSITLDSGLNS